MHPEIPLARIPLVGIRGRHLFDIAASCAGYVNEPKVAAEVQCSPFLGELGSIVAGKSERALPQAATDYFPCPVEGDSFHCTRRQLKAYLAWG